MKIVFILLISCVLILEARVYTFSGGEDNTVMLIASKVLLKAYSKAGIEIKPLFLTLEESLQRSNSGRTDGELARIEKITRLYPNLRQVPVEIVAVEAIAFSKNSSLHIKNWSDLRGHNITIVQGTKFIEQGTKGIAKQTALTFEEAFDALHKDKTEIVVVPKLAGLHLSYANAYQDIKPVSSALQRLPLYHFVHKKNIHLIPVITPVLDEMKKSGEIDYIHHSYLRSITHPNP
jgi:polar amino acid transport system substrate-binding protein